MTAEQWQDFMESLHKVTQALNSLEVTRNNVAKDFPVAGRQLSLGITNIEQGYMWLEKAMRNMPEPLDSPQ